MELGPTAILLLFVRKLKVEVLFPVVLLQHLPLQVREGGRGGKEREKGRRGVMRKMDSRQRVGEGSEQDL